MEEKEEATVTEPIETKEARLSRIESTQARTVANLETLSADLNRMAVAIDTLRDALASTGKTQWNVLGTWVGVVMAIGAAVIAPQISDIRDMRGKTAEHAVAIQENAIHLGRLEERLEGQVGQVQKQTARTREEIDWVWDLLHSRFGYRESERGRKNPNVKDPDL